MAPECDYRFQNDDAVCKHRRVSNAREVSYTAIEMKLQP